MAARKRILGLFLIGVVTVAVFGAGYEAGSSSAQPQVYTGSGYDGANVATLGVGDTYYGFRDSVSWTDSAGSFHDGGWPDCLPRVQEVSGVRFAGATIWAGGIGLASVVWVDCRSQ